MTMPCPTCGGATEVLDTRDVAARPNYPAYVRRRRVCLKKSSHRFTTMEIIAQKTVQTRGNRLSDIVEQKRKLSFGKAIADTLRRMAYHTEKNGLMDYCDSRGPNQVPMKPRKGGGSARRGG